MKRKPKIYSDKISIVIPVYNSAESLPILTDRLQKALTEMGRKFEVVFVDDRSRDNSWQVVKGLRDRYGTFIKIARLLVNSGQHNAILCGMYLATGDIVITIDDDLQNPPEEIPKLISAIDQGYDLAIASYDEKKHSGFRNASGWFIDSVIRRIFNLPNTFQLTSFRAAKRVVVDNVCKMGGVFPYITAMMLANAANYTNVSVRHDARPFGSSNYSLRRSLSLAANLIFYYSSYPLYVIAALSFFFFLGTFIFGISLIIRTLVYGSAVPGWASTILAISFSNAFILLCLVIFGVYISRMSQQLTRTRLPYTVSELHE